MNLSINLPINYNLTNMEATEQRPNQPAANNPSNISIICHLCRGFLMNSKTVGCGHVFCSFCLEEYFLFVSTCPICLQQIRDGDYYHNIILDKLVIEYLKKWNIEEFQIYEKRLNIHKQYKKKRLLTKIEAGDIIDVRDHKHVWHKARVMKTFRKQFSGKRFIKFRYMDSISEDQLHENSNKIAPNGFFTDRNDIPKNFGGLTMIKNSKSFYLFEEK